MSWKRDKNAGGIVGVLQIREIEKSSGKILSEFKDRNVITLDGMAGFWQRMARRDLGTDYRLSHFVFGEDTGLEEGGDWTIFLPKPANRFYTSANQFNIYEDIPANTNFQYPDENTMQVGTLIDGEYVLDTFYPGDVDKKYNSATLRFETGEVFSYKRFPVRTISRLVDVQVIWTFYLVDSALYDCSLEDFEPITPEPNHDFGISVYTGYWSSNEIHKIDSVGDPVWTYTEHTDWVNDLSIDDTYLYSVSRDMSIHVINLNTGATYQTIAAAHSDIINRVMVDGNFIVTVGNDNHVRKFDMESGDLEWEFTPGDGINAMDVVKGIDDNYYAAFRDGHVYKINSGNGSEIWRYNTEYELVRMVVDRDDDLYLSILDDDPNGEGYAIKKFRPSNQTYRYTLLDFTGYIFGMAVDDDYNLFIGDDQNTVRMFDRIGDEIWRFTRHTDIVRGLDRDQFGYIYSASIDQTIRKITPNGNQVWAYVGNENPAASVIAGLTPEN